MPQASVRHRGAARSLTLADVPALMVAAGGGGDPLACVVLHRALRLPPPLLVATLAWERLMVDPEPGPRPVTGFTGLAAPAPMVAEVTAATDTVPPDRSTLPGFVRHSGARLFLLDATSGGAGMGGQLERLVDALGVDHVYVVDVGGDALAAGDEPGLRSPLADALSLAGCVNVRVPADLLIAGPGLDGELHEDYVVQRARDLGGRHLVTLAPEDFAAVAPLLAWHPSESTSVLHAAVVGERGVVETRSAGVRVRMTDLSTQVLAIRVPTVAGRSRLVDAVARTTTLSAAEAVCRRVTGRSEIDYERHRARARAGNGHGNRPAVQRYLADAARRGVDFVTQRRLVEATDYLSERAGSEGARVAHHLVSTSSS